MDFISTGTEILKQENVLTPRQKDIIDTEKEMLKSPFDRNTAIGQVEKNCMSYPELALGVTVPIAIRGRSLEQMTNDDILKILQLQFGYPDGAAARRKSNGSVHPCIPLRARERVGRQRTTTLPNTPPSYKFTDRQRPRDFRTVPGLLPVFAFASGFVMLKIKSMTRVTVKQG